MAAFFAGMAQVREWPDWLSRKSGLEFAMEDALALARPLHGGKGSLHRAGVSTGNCCKAG